jgi:cytochrome b561
MLSTKPGAGHVAVSIHWVSVLLILILIDSGFRAANTVDPSAKAALLRIHIPIAVGLLTLTIFRIVWWWGLDRKPKPVAGSPRWQERAAQVVHILFYVVILGMVASGIGMVVLSGAAPLIFGGQSALLPDFWELSATDPTRDRSAISPCLPRTPRRCHSLSSFRSPRRSVLAHVVQYATQ